MRRRDPGFKTAPICRQPPAFGGEIQLTPLMRKRLTPRAARMVERSLAHFPELHGRAITIGCTRKHLGSASIAYRNGEILRLVIRLKVRKLTYQTIGHELTHLIQALARESRRPEAHHESIPSGEKQCDIWTLARHELFCDDPPSYLRLPRAMREAWPHYAAAVRALCIGAIEKRETRRRYIRWLETAIDKLPRPPFAGPASRGQLELPF